MYFDKEKFEKMKTIDEIYEYLLFLLHEKLWVPANQRSPNWPVGATRVVQIRVLTEDGCASNQNIEAVPCHQLYDEQEKEQLLSCLSNIYSQRCN